MASPIVVVVALLFAAGPPGPLGQAGPPGPPGGPEIVGSTRGPEIAGPSLCAQPGAQLVGPVSLAHSIWLTRSSSVNLAHSI